MRGRFAAGAEILRRVHEAATEEVLPDLIDRNACGERIFWSDQPAGRVEAIRVRTTRLQGRQNARRACADFFTFAQEIATHMDVRAGGSGSFEEGFGLRLGVLRPRAAVAGELAVTVSVRF